MEWLCFQGRAGVENHICVLKVATLATEHDENHQHASTSTMFKQVYKSSSSSRGVRCVGFERHCDGPYIDISVCVTYVCMSLPLDIHTLARVNA